MKVEPGFPTHWKTERLIERVGADGVVVLLRIWGNAQIRREWTGLKWNPKRLAMETKWKGNENHLWDALTDPDAPWLDIAEDGTVSIHDFEEHQKQVIHLWGAGGKGGRPKKEKPSSSSSSTSSSSSSYPICEPYENHMVSECLLLSTEESPKPLKFNATPEMLRIGRIINPNRRDSTKWSKEEAKAFKAIEFIEDEISLVEDFYRFTERDREPLYRRTSLLTLLRHWNDEVGKANKWAAKYGRSRATTTTKRTGK